jgi:hypothetical protein
MRLVLPMDCHPHHGNDQYEVPISNHQPGSAENLEKIPFTLQRECATTGYTKPTRKDEYSKYL